jgi:hypothetical protein
MRFSKTPLIAALLAVSVASAPGTAAELMKPRESGDLVVVVAAADSPDYIREWMETRFEDSPRLERLNETAIGEWLYISFLVTGLTPSAEAAYDFTVGYRLLRPDGSILFDEPAQATNRSKGTARRGWVMSDPALDLLFDETDPPGRYTLEVRVRDNIAGAEATTTHIIHLQDHR